MSLSRVSIEWSPLSMYVDNYIRRYTKVKEFDKIDISVGTEVHHGPKIMSIYLIIVILRLASSKKRKIIDVFIMVITLNTFAII